MLHHVNASDTLDSVRETHYRFHHKIDPSIYPQVHDFYELTLVTQGCMELEACGRKSELRQGALVLLRPGDVHSRRAKAGCAHINLAFPARVIRDMFLYLDDPDTEARIRQAEHPPQTVLTSGEALLLQTRLEKLNMLPGHDPRAARVELRHLMLDIILEHIVPAVAAPPHILAPVWLASLLEQLDSPEAFSEDLEGLARRTGRTKEHLCRSFRKYLGVSPSAYLNAKRLNYAANLLRHSDQKVVDIAFAAGFQSLSRFYHAFKAEFGMTPLACRRAAALP